MWSNITLNCSFFHFFTLQRKSVDIDSMNLLKRINNVIFPDTQKITEEVIQYYEQNPDELDLIINRELFNSLYLGIIFILGIGLTVASRVVGYVYGEVIGDFVNDVVLDVLSELGIAIFGGAVVAYLIETLNKRQYQQNVKFRREIKRILEEKKIDK